MIKADSALPRSMREKPVQVADASLAKNERYPGGFIIEKIVSILFMFGLVMGFSQFQPSTVFAADKVVHETIIVPKIQHMTGKDSGLWQGKN